MRYKRAWQCNKCPETNGENGCPAWAELVETHIRTGEERITKQCLFRLLPRLLLELTKASNRPAAELGELRAELYQGFAAMAKLPFQRVLNDGADQ